MSRSVNEWIGATPDARIPPRVRLRVFERHGGICHLTGVKITARDKWDCDHVIALINGGEHKESNLAPALRKAHRVKTAHDVKLKAKTARIRMRRAGIKKPRTITRWRKFNGDIVNATRER